MEAGSRLLRSIILVACGLLVVTWCRPIDAAGARSQNFIVEAPTQQLANDVAQAAERYRDELAEYWLGQRLRPWPTPCPIMVIAGPNLAAQGVTTYNPRPVRDFQMEVIGTPERILDSVLPHEVTHTVLATHFGRPLPRWADEGICTTVEHASERRKHDAKLLEFLGTRRGIAMNQLFLLTEYPPDVLPMYAQGYSVCKFLIDQQGPREFINFLEDYMRHPSWTANVKKHYQYDSLKELQDYWLAWVKDGSADVGEFAKIGSPVQLAGHSMAEPGDGNVALALHDPRGASSDSAVHQPAAGTALDAAGTALDQAVSDGWYLRRRDEAKNRGTKQPLVAENLPIRPLAPPSVLKSGRYQSAQPQGEQQISRGQPLRGGYSPSNSSIYRR